MRELNLGQYQNFKLTHYPASGSIASHGLPQ